MSFEIAKPSTFLKPYIKQYWATESVLDTGKQHTQRIIATGLPELSFYFGNIPKSDKRNIEGSTLLNGQQNDYYDLIIAGQLSMFSVTFQPNGLSHFLKIPMNELHNQTVFLETIDKAFSQQLGEKLAASDSFKNRILIVENYFLQRLGIQQISVDHQRMSHSIELITSAKGIISIDFLASKACLSRKQFERIFLKHIGISPKQFLKIIRFQNAIYLKQSLVDINMTELAYEAGFYDQPHFINEIKELTGQTPKIFFETAASTSDFFS